MASNDPKKRSITGRLVANKLTDREFDFTLNVIYLAKRSIKDICKLAEVKSKHTAAELESMYGELHEQALTELYNGSTVEFGFANNSLGVDGAFKGPDAEFDPEVNSVVLRCSPRTEYKKYLQEIGVIVAGTSEGLPVITSVIDMTTGSIDNKITPGGGLNGSGNRINIAGEEGKEVGYYFVSAKDETSIVKVPATSLLRNDPSFFSLIIPQLADGGYYLEVATQSSTNTKKMLKEPRRNRFPFMLTVGSGGEDERPGEL